MRSALIVAVAVLTIAAAPPAKVNGQSNGQANGQGCSSVGGTGSTPGQWYKSLQDNPQLEGLTPAEMAELENATPGGSAMGKRRTSVPQFANSVETKS
jgi:hypothetical protein